MRYSVFQTPAKKKKKVLTTYHSWKGKYSF